ncbi:MAG: discoidin domain-containing protein [Phycisphaerae bacterium]
MTHRRTSRLAPCLLGALVLAMSAGAPPAAGDAAAWRDRLEAEWLHPRMLDQVRRTGAKAGAGRVTTRRDAAGAVDGRKSGKWGFHTAHETDPWWQVDLGEVRPVARVVLWNRCDPGMAERMKDFALLLSADGTAWREVYRHGGTVFYGHSDGKPLAIPTQGEAARFLRIRLNGTNYFHLDEVEVYGPDDAEANLALGRPADQSSTSRWSKRHAAPGRTDYPVARVLERGRRLADDLAGRGADVAPHRAALADVAKRLKRLGPDASQEAQKALYLAARRAVRNLVFANPLLDFDRILFAKRAAPQFPHMSDQFYGWWSRGGGGLFVLENFKGDGPPTVTCLTDDWPDGTFLRPMLSYDGKRILFAYATYDPEVAKLKHKTDKQHVPEDAFFHVYEMNVDGTGVRQLTRGKYDDFDARYLPDGRIVFLSTRRGQAVACGPASARATLGATRPDSYVRCGGGDFRPVAIYTLHVMDSGGGNLEAISAFENFEWTPSVASDGRILYARWDYVDRHNGPYMSLWSTNPDGTNPAVVYGNFTRNPQCIFEARSVPGSGRLVFTASAHHSNLGGSLCLLDPDVGVDGPEPLTRLTPEVCFPETEGWPATYYANPWPLSEAYYLVAWSTHRLPPHTYVHDKRNPVDAMGLYVYDAFGNLEPLYRDPAVSCQYPTPIRARPTPAAVAPRVARTGDEGGGDGGGAREGRFLLQDVYDGLGGVARGEVKRLRVVAVPAKVQPQMNRPVLGVTREDPGKCVLGTVPVEADGSAYFRVPAGVSVFFQALDARGRAVQTMRTITYVQPGQTLGCIGCHEPRDEAPAVEPLQAQRRPASRLRPGPEGTWPLRFDRLVRPVLDAHCVRCHGPDGRKEAVARLNLAPGKAYQSLVGYGGDKGLAKHVESRWRGGRSVAGACAARESPILAMLTSEKGHHDVRLGEGDLARLITWMDTYAQRRGAFSDEQERRLLALREQWADLLDEP